MLFAIVYSVVGITFALPTHSARSHAVVVAWRLAAWLVSAATFGAHIAYEHFRVRNPPTGVALHAAVAVAFGAFLLALWVNVHARSPLALIVFPAVTGVPAFVVALIAVTILARLGS